MFNYDVEQRGFKAFMMEGWQSDWIGALEALAEDVEQVCEQISQDLFQGVCEWADAITELSNDLCRQIEMTLEEVSTDLAPEIQQLELQLDEWASSLLDAFLWDSEPTFPSTTPSLDLEFCSPASQPEVCTGCQHYHGQVYGGTPLICAMHPYGWLQDAPCPDWDSDRDVPPELP